MATTTSSQAIVVNSAGDHVLSLNTAQLEILKISDGSKIGDLTLNGQQGQIKLNKQETHAYVGTFDKKFIIVDISNYASPTNIGEITLLGVQVQDIVVSKLSANRVYVGSHYFSILDISDPTTITKVDVAVDCRFLAVNSAETRAYCSSDTKLFTLDISDKSNPFKMHEQVQPGAGAVVISYDDQILYTGVGASGIRIYTLSGAYSD